MPEHLRKADWLVKGIPDHAEAVHAIEAGHYAKGASNTSTYRHGLYRSDLWPLVADLCGVALWMPPTRVAAETLTTEWGGVLSLSRLWVHPDVPTNGASFLLGASMKFIDRKRWPWLLTYADTAEGHTGAIYLAAGWTCLGEVPAGDTWVNAKGRQMGRKRGGRTLTVAEMVALGFTRKASAPKVKFVHHVPPTRAKARVPSADARPLDGLRTAGRPPARPEESQEPRI